MAKEYTITKEEGIKRICEAIREAYAISDAIDDKHLATNSTFSSVKIDSLLSDIDTRVDKLENGSISGSVGNIVSANSSYTLDDSVDYPLMGLNMYGKSIQQRYNGKNLFDFNAWKNSISSVTNGTAVYGKNSIKLTATDNHCDVLGENYIAVKPSTTYTLSWNADSDKYGGIDITMDGFPITGTGGDNSETKKVTFTTNSDTTSIRVQFGVQNAGESITYSNIQLEVGETATSYEPYVGGVPAPNPNYPQEIKSVGDSGTVNIASNNGADISVTASITSSLPLCGIPVESGGNYTDSTGQQWVCDELIYNADGTGKIIKRINKIIFNGSEDWKLSGNGKSAFLILSDDIKVKYKNNLDNAEMFSNKYVAGSYNDYYNATKTCISTAENGALVLYDERFAYNIEALKADMAANNLRVVYPLAKPQEIELTASEMTALRQLQTFNGTTSISNSAGAEMNVKYCTNKALSEYVLPIFNGMQAQIDELRTAVLSLGGNV